MCFTCAQPHPLGSLVAEEEQLFVSKGIGNAYQKARYQEYTDEAFTVCPRVLDTILPARPPSLSVPPRP